MNNNHVRYVLALSLMVVGLAHGVDPDFNALMRGLDEALALGNNNRKELSQIKNILESRQRTRRLEQRTPDRAARRTPSLKLREVPVKEEKKEPSSSRCNGVTRNLCIIGGCALAIKILSAGYLVVQCT